MLRPDPQLCPTYNPKVSIFGSYHWSLVTQSLFYMFLLTSPLNVYGLGSGVFNYRFSRIFLLLTVFAIVIERLLKMHNLLLKLRPFEYFVCIYCFLAFLSALYVPNYGAFATRFFGLIECILILYVVRIFTHEEGYWLKSVQIYLLSSITTEILKHSSLLMNRHFVEADAWDESGIEKRGTELFEYAKEIWSYEGYNGLLDEKYNACNISHLREGDYGTIEFRLFDATLSYKKLKEQIYWTLCFIKDALERE